MAASYQSPAEYIGHHLTFFAKPVGDTPFMTLNMDSIIVSVILGVVSLGFFWWVTAGATSGVPSKKQAFVELCFEFVDNQVKGIFHGERHKFVTPLAMTVGVWVLLMNAMDFLPVDIMSWFISLFGEHAAHGFRIVPTADVNTTFALALSVWLLMIGFAIKVKGLGGWIHEIYATPFGTGPWWAAPFMITFNVLFNLVEYISKPLSHSLRLFGNMYAGEIIFLLLWLMATAGVVAMGIASLLAFFWAIFHILIVGLQAYIFMMLTIVYIAMAHESH
jgi:F-type H+-transporting ATPase subunit a